MGRFVVDASEGSWSDQPQAALHENATANGQRPARWARATELGGVPRRHDCKVAAVSATEALCNGGRTRRWAGLRPSWTQIARPILFASMTFVQHHDGLALASSYEE
jgi:hypothetical protein